MPRASVEVRDGIQYKGRRVVGSHSRDGYHSPGSGLSVLLWRPSQAATDG